MARNIGDMKREEWNEFMDKFADELLVRFDVAGSVAGYYSLYNAMEDQYERAAIALHKEKRCADWRQQRAKERVANKARRYEFFLKEREGGASAREIAAKFGLKRGESNRYSGKAEAPNQHNGVSSGSLPLKE